jgi:hypothetical protein
VVTHLRKSRLLLLLLLIAVYGCGARDKTPADDPVAGVIASVIETYGGEEALRNTRGYHMKGIQLATQTQEVIHVERWFGSPNRLRIELTYPDHHESRFTDGDQGWAGSSPADIRPAHPVRLQAMRLQTARLDTPLRLLDHEEEVELRDPDGEGRTVLRLPIDSSLYIDYHIHPDTYRIERMSMWMPGPPEMVFAADYTQFHQIEGVLIAFQELTYAGGTKTSRFQVTDFEWNPDDLDTTLRPGIGAWD